MRAELSELGDHLLLAEIAILNIIMGKIVVHARNKFYCIHVTVLNSTDSSHSQLKRYKTYAYLLRSRLAFTEVEPSLVKSSIGEVDEGIGALLNSDVALIPPPVPDRPAINRYSYRAAIYNRNLLNGQDYGGDIG